MSAIKAVKARQIFDGRDNPTVEVSSYFHFLIRCLFYIRCSFQFQVYIYFVAAIDWKCGSSSITWILDFESVLFVHSMLYRSRKQCECGYVTVYYEHLQSLDHLVMYLVDDVVIVKLVANWKEGGVWLADSL